MSIEGTVTSFAIPTANSQPKDIALGPDGNLWFTEHNGGRIGRITTTGVIAEFSIPSADNSPSSITAGPDGNLWFTEESLSTGKIGRITPQGVITEFALPSSPIGGGGAHGITLGPDGNLWFTQAGASANRIGRITTSGQITEYPVPTLGIPWEIAPGPDGNLWFTERSGNRIGRITPNGVITEFPLPCGSAESGTCTPSGQPLGITAGPDGAIWFTEVSGNRIGRITRSGEITEFTIPTFASGPVDITLGPDGHLWFTEGTAAQIATIREGTCAAGATALCLNDARFKVEVSWSVPSQGRSGVGRALSLTSDSGAFWFFDSSNLELLVKVVDGRSFNGHFWVFYGALSDVEYRVTVTDTQQPGTSRTYLNRQGQVSSVADTAAFRN